MWTCRLEDLEKLDHGWLKRRDLINEADDAKMMMQTFLKQIKWWVGFIDSQEPETVVGSDFFISELFLKLFKNINLTSCNYSID